VLDWSHSYTIDTLQNSKCWYSLATNQLQVQQI